MTNQLQNKMDEDTEAKLIKSEEANLCLYNIPESPSDDPKTAAIEDLVKLKEVLKGRISLNKNDIVRMRRTGERSNVKSATASNALKTGPSAVKARPIIITFSNQSKRLEVLKLRNLSYVDVNQFTTKVYFSPDRTPKHREIHRTGH